MISVSFDNLDEELYHLALVLAGDSKANAIKVLRRYDHHFNGRLQDVVNYIVNYIDFCIAGSPDIGYQKHCMLSDELSSMPMSLPNDVWYKVLEYKYHDANETHPIIKPSIVPLSENYNEDELRRIANAFYLPFMPV